MRAFLYAAIMASFAATTLTACEPAYMAVPVDSVDVHDVKGAH